MPRRWRLRGPTGERNLYELHPRSKVLGLAPDEEDRLVQLAAVLAESREEADYDLPVVPV